MLSSIIGLVKRFWWIVLGLILLLSWDKILAFFSSPSSTGTSNFPNQNGKSKGMKNNNPFNLKDTTSAWEGVITPTLNPPWEQFKTMDYGIRAGVINLKGLLAKDSINNLTTLVKTYSEDNWEAYVNYLVKAVGIPSNVRMLGQNPTQKNEMLLTLASSIVEFENGKDVAIQQCSRDMIKSVMMKFGLFYPDEFSTDSSTSGSLVGDAISFNSDAIFNDNYFAV